MLVNLGDVVAPLKLRVWPFTGALFLRSEMAPPAIVSNLTGVRQSFGSHRRATNPQNRRQLRVGQQSEILKTFVALSS